MQSIVLRSARRSLLLLRLSNNSVSTWTSSVVILRKPSSFTVQTCLLRTRKSGQGEHEKKAEENNEKEEEPRREEKDGKQEPPKEMDPAIARKLRIYVLIVGGISFVTSFFLLSRMYKEGSGLPAGTSAEHFTKPGIEFNVFVQKYLKAGEVKSIVFCPQAYKAIAYLHDGAIIDNEKAKNNYVVVSFTGNAQQFWADIRKEEGLLGISVTNGVPIQIYQGMSGWRVVELLIGVAIVAYLGTQYGRLLRQRVFAKKAGGTPPPKQP